MDEFTVTTPGLVYLKANKSFSGGYGGMWYRLKYTDGTLSACVWPFPWCFEKTDDTQKAFAEFPFDADGLARAEAWVAAQYEADVPRWSACPAMPPPTPEETAAAGEGNCPRAGLKCCGGSGSCPCSGRGGRAVRFVADTPAVHWLIRSKKQSISSCFLEMDCFFRAASSSKVLVQRDFSGFYEIFDHLNLRRRAGIQHFNDGFYGRVPFHGRIVIKQIIHTHLQNCGQIDKHRQAQLCIACFNVAHMRDRNTNSLG